MKQRGSRLAKNILKDYYIRLAFNKKKNNKNCHSNCEQCRFETICEDKRK